MGNYQGNRENNMKTISKILYGLISFSVFAAYKIETAWAAWRVTLASYSLASFCSNTNGVAGASATAQKIKSRQKIVTLCSPGDGKLAGCKYKYTSENGDVIEDWCGADGANTSFTSLATLAEYCDTGNAECLPCPSGGLLIDHHRSTQLLRPNDDYKGKFTLNVCDYYTLTEMGNVYTPYNTEADLANGDKMLLEPIEGQQMNQTYEVEFLFDSNNWLSMSDDDNCYKSPGMEMTGNSGIFISEQNCQYLHSNL